MFSKYKLFFLIFFPAALALLIGLAVVQENNAGISRDQFEELLKNQWFMVSMIYRNPAHDELFKEIDRATQLRITIVSATGEVIFDSEAEGGLEDHKNREEIRNAFQGYPTLATRLSRTTRKPTFYFAQKLDDTTVLRVAYPAEYFERNKAALLKSVLSGMIILILLLFAFATLITRRNAKTLRELGEAVETAKIGGDDFRSFDSPSLDSALYSLSTASKNLFEVNQSIAALNKRLEYILGNIEEGAVLFEKDKVVYKNKSASQILGFELPLFLRDLTNPVEITAAEALIAPDAPAELKIGDKTVTVARTDSSHDMLAILHDITDFQKYNLYKSILVGNISHELKTPLAIIMTAAETVISDSSMPDDTRAKFLRNIYRNSRRVNILIDDLIELHTLENGRDAEPAESDLGEIASEIMDIADPGGKNIEYNIDRGAVGIHSAHLISIMTNLISNAVKYSKGPIIKADLKKDDNTVTISVSDGGPPIPPAEKERIFERFYSMSKSRNRESGGSGLGLSIVKHIAKLYKGEARVLGSDMGGNTFEVRLIQKK